MRNVRAELLDKASRSLDGLDHVEGGFAIVVNDVGVSAVGLDERLEERDVVVGSGGVDRGVWEIAKAFSLKIYGMGRRRRYIGGGKRTSVLVLRVDRAGVVRNKVKNRGGVVVRSGNPDVGGRHDGGTGNIFRVSWRTGERNVEVEGE